MAEGLASVSIPKELIEPVIKAHVAEAIAKALDNSGHLMRVVVDKIMMQHVDSNGRPSSSSYDKDTWLDWAVGNTIKAAALKAIEETIVQSGDAIKATLVKQLQAKNSPLMRSLADALCTGVFKTEHLKYAISIQIKDGRS
jgi:hypothetical protein